MPNIKKAVVGIRPVRKLFRIDSLWGSSTDAVLDLRDQGPFRDDYFTSVTYSPDQTTVSLRNEIFGNFLTMTAEHIVFTKDYYSGESRFVFEEFLKEFRLIWEALDSVLKLRNIRRIGFVGEHRFPYAKGPTGHLVSTLTKLKYGGYADKFGLTFESRSMVGGNVPDPKTGDFINIIRSIYDGSRDTDHPEEGCINANLDVQRYYAPSASGRVADEFLKLYNKEYIPASQEFFEQIDKLGVRDGEAKWTPASTAEPSLTVRCDRPGERHIHNCRRCRAVRFRRQGYRPLRRAQSVV